MKKPEEKCMTVILDFYFWVYQQWSEDFIITARTRHSYLFRANISTATFYREYMDWYFRYLAPTYWMRLRLISSMGSFHHTAAGRKACLLLSLLCNNAWLLAIAVTGAISIFILSPDGNHTEADELSPLEYYRRRRRGTGAYTYVKSAFLSEMIVASRNFNGWLPYTSRRLFTTCEEEDMNARRLYRSIAMCRWSFAEFIASS